MTIHIGFTGSRNITPQERVALREWLHAQPWPEECHLLFGGALGTDTELLRWFADSTVGQKLTVVVPWTFNNQPKEAREAIRDAPCELVELRHDSPVGAAIGYVTRNEWLVDRSDRIVGLWKGRSASGTAQTMRYAIQAGKLWKVERLDWL